MQSTLSILERFTFDRHCGHGEYNVCDTEFDIYSTLHVGNRLHHHTHCLFPYHDCELQERQTFLICSDLHRNNCTDWLIYGSEGYPRDQIRTRYGSNTSIDLFFQLSNISGPSASQHHRYRRYACGCDRESDHVKFFYCSLTINLSPSYVHDACGHRHGIYGHISFANQGLVTNLLNPFWHGTGTLSAKGADKFCMFSMLTYLSQMRMTSMAFSATRMTRI